MRKLVVFMHTSLDGFVAGPNGEMNWIRVDDEIFEYAGHQTDRSDTALYGRVTFQMMDSYWPTAGDQPNASRHDKQHAEWYNSVDKVVVSRTMEGVDLPRVTVVSKDLKSRVLALKQSAGKDIVIFGSPSAVHELTADNLIDEYWLFVNPVLLGEGIPMFMGIGRQISLELVSSKAFDAGVVCLHYQVPG
jgi:dihydrofolate reductase